MGGSFVKIEGLDKTLARFDMKKYEPQVQTCFNNFGIRVEAAAKQAAPVDEGHLKGAIFQQSSRLASTFGCSVNYASYVEFGTRKYASETVSKLPADWQAFAASTKGKGGGTFKEFVERLVGWVSRKGLGTGFAGPIGVAGTYSVKSRRRTGSKTTQALEDRQAAYAIALTILRNGVKAQPFLYPAYDKYKDLLLKDLNDIKI